MQKSQVQKLSRQIKKTSQVNKCSKVNMVKKSQINLNISKNASQIQNSQVKKCQKVKLDKLDQSSQKFIKAKIKSKNVSSQSKSIIISRANLSQHWFIDY